MVTGLEMSSEPPQVAKPHELESGGQAESVQEIVAQPKMKRAQAQDGVT